MYLKMAMLFSFFIASAISVVLYQLYLIHLYDNEPFEKNTTTSLPADANIPVLLWWTPFGDNDQLKTCEDEQCYFTYDRTFEKDSRLKGILFYGSKFRVGDIPKFRSKYVQWGLIHEESPRNNPMFVHEQALNLFNYSSTFSRFSNVPLTLIDLPSIKELLGRDYFIPVRRKTELMREQNLAPVLYIQSDCDTASDRDTYVLELMKYIKIDSYGSCINNMHLNERFKDNYLDILTSSEFLSFVAQYKFTIAFENAICYDYITEKLWRPLIVGSVPIYYGSPTFRDWLPNNKSAVSTLDFANPQNLAKHLLKLASNDSEYNEYLSHKLIPQHKQSINEHLFSALSKREKNTLNDFGNYVDKFQCYVCKQIHNSTKVNSIMSKKHYNCPLPQNPVSHKVDETNVWVHQWNFAKCGAKLLAHYIPNNISIKINDFDELKLNLYNDNNC